MADKTEKLIEMLRTEFNYVGTEQISGNTALKIVLYTYEQVKNLNEETETKPTRIPCEYPDCNCLITCAWYERNEA